MRQATAATEGPDPAATIVMEEVVRKENLEKALKQALLQVMTPVYGPTFSPHSYGFRPGRNAHQAVRQAQAYIEEGYEWVVDIWTWTAGFVEGSDARL